MDDKLKNKYVLKKFGRLNLSNKKKNVSYLP
jgi:hypothetical protein